MQEYVTRAVVLDKQLRNDADARYSFFTERYGKIAAKATSSRKIVSKLAGHLEPGTVAAIKIIETHGAQVIDALKISRIGTPIAQLAALNNLLPEWQPDAELWHELVQLAPTDSGVVTASAKKKFSWTNALAILGWDPNGAVCAHCNLPDRSARYFYIPRQEFFCASCTAASRFGRDALILVDGQ
jgi:recombinational DNA repair protein (RecF pathway)